MTEYSAYALMPLNTPYDFVFDSVKRAAESLHESDGITIVVDNASQYVETKGSKVDEIRRRIRKADFLVIDFSTRSSNVMWEFGFAQCLNKHIIALDSSLGPNPFNIGETDKICYQLSKAGLADLEKTLRLAYRRTIKSINAESGPLIEEKTVMHLRDELDDCLRSIPRGSVTHKLVTNELERITRRVASIKTSHFELRNYKPTTEIIAYYADYLSQLDGGECSFETVTCCDFWVTITNRNRSKTYLEANKRALEQGAAIRRVFVLSEEGMARANAECNHLMDQVLNEHHSWIESGLTDRLWVGVIVVADKDAERSYPNIGLLRRKDEHLYFKPQYDGSGSMEKTLFFYSQGNVMKREIKAARDDFDVARRRAKDLRSFALPWQTGVPPRD